MYVVAGATGRVGSATARNLLDAGEQVRVLVRSQAAADDWSRQGAECRVVDLRDRAALGGALAGCVGFFALLPFDLTASDPAAHEGAVVAALAGAVTDQAVPHVVALSSGGADLTHGTGPIAGLHRLEQALLATGAVVTALRSGHFQEKVGDVVGVARSSGTYPVFATSADALHPMGATGDVGAVAARVLRSPTSVSEAVDVLGPHYSEREVARALGDALGRQLEVVTLPEPAWGASLADAGVPPHVAPSLAELYRADEAGMLAPRGDRTVHVATSIETTIARLVAA